jgi:hypothetical protein
MSERERKEGRAEVASVEKFRHTKLPAYMMVTLPAIDINLFLDIS